jgi:pyruvate dehydrogenase E1 component alpha subunit
MATSLTDSPPPLQEAAGVTGGSDSRRYGAPEGRVPRTYDGAVITPRDAVQPRTSLRQLYRTMCRIHAFEERAEQAFADGRIVGAVHVSIGQEAVAAGVCAHLGDADLITSTHRGHGHAIAKGVDPGAMMRELLGRVGGTCAGKGGSMHIADLRVGMLGANGIVPDGLTVGVGAAHALKLRGLDAVVVSFFGDGGVNRGPFLEGLNWARIHSLPILFVCEHNGFGSTTRTDAMTAGDGAVARALALDVPAREVDGNDVLLVAGAAGELLAEMRAGGGPRLLLARTYRLRGHTANDPATYRGAAEVADAARLEPIARAAAQLARDGTTERDLAADRARADEEMDDVLQAATDAPFPPPEAAYADVQDAGGGDPAEPAWAY